MPAVRSQVGKSFWQGKSVHERRDLARAGTVASVRSSLKASSSKKVKEIKNLQGEPQSDTVDLGHAARHPSELRLLVHLVAVSCIDALKLGPVPAKEKKN